MLQHCICYNSKRQTGVPLVDLNEPYASRHELKTTMQYLTLLVYIFKIFLLNIKKFITIFWIKNW